MRKNIIFLFLFLSGFLLAQNEGNIWYFGDNAGLDFNSGTPVALTNGALYAREGCASICDNLGGLLFYTNGIEVWNKNHQIMPNGFGLKGADSSTQSAIIVKKPGSNSIYFIFTVDERTGLSANNQLMYSEVDMSLQGGLGDINSNKNISIVSPVCEKLVAILHQNKSDIWIVVHIFNSNSFHSYLLTSSGLNITPIISNAGIALTGVTENMMGYLKASIDGSRIASANSNLYNVEVFDFNNSNGIISNPLTLTGFSTNPSYGNGPYGVEFSPNNKFLYVSYEDFPAKIDQFDLLAGSSAAINTSRINIGNAGWNYGSAIQRGPDGKLYCAYLDNTSIGIINNPDLLGLACNYTTTLSLAGKLSKSGLPALPVISVDNEMTTLPDTGTCNFNLKMPNSFSPNGDGFNNLYIPLIYECVNQASITIHNRWGQELFHSSNLNEGWNGRTTAGKYVPVGTYYWIVNYIDMNENSSNLKGFVTVIR